MPPPKTERLPSTKPEGRNVTPPPQTTTSPATREAMRTSDEHRDDAALRRAYRISMLAARKPSARGALAGGQARNRPAAITAGRSRARARRNPKSDRREQRAGSRA